MSRVYDTHLWAEARARTLARDGGRCTVARLIGGECHPTLDVHHLIPVDEGGALYDDANLLTCCKSHHQLLHRLRRLLLDGEERPWRCPHKHPTAEGRRACEEKHAARLAA